MVNPSNPVPEVSRRPVAVVGTLMPHLAAGRHHVYRDVTALALLAALIAAGLGSLPVALVLTAVALPAAVLVYVHDHRLWHDEPITVIAVTFGLSLLLGVGVGLLETYFVHFVVLPATKYHLPPVSRIIELSVLVPVAAFVAVVVAPLVVSARSAFRHPMDVVVACSLSGAALSLGLSVVVQHGAFAHVQATAGDPAHVAFIALTLGFLQPIVLATAAMVGVLGLRRLGVNPAAGVIEGLVLVVAYELATTLLQPYGTRGIVLTTLAAFALAGAGLVLARNALHAAMLADAGTGEDTVAAGAGARSVEHRLHATTVAAIIAVVVLIAAAVTSAVVWGGPPTNPQSPGGSGGILPHPAAAAATHPMMGRSGDSHWGTVVLASSATSLAFGTPTTIDLGSGVTLTPAAGWTNLHQGPNWVQLGNSDRSAVMFASAGKAGAPDISQEATRLINAESQAVGLTNVQQRSSAPEQVAQGRNFQQVLEVDYTANEQTDQGTMQVAGAWVTLFNSATQSSGFLDLCTNGQDTFKAATPDAGSMLASMK